jgi:hypothetical protein
MDAKMRSKNRKIIVYTGHCPALPKEPINIRNIHIEFPPKQQQSCHPRIKVMEQ